MANTHSFDRKKGRIILHTIIGTLFIIIHNVCIIILLFMCTYVQHVQYGYNCKFQVLRIWFLVLPLLRVYVVVETFSCHRLPLRDIVVPSVHVDYDMSISKLAGIHLEVRRSRPGGGHHLAVHRVGHHRDGDGIFVPTLIVQ